MDFYKLTRRILLILGNYNLFLKENKKELKIHNPFRKINSNPKKIK